MKLPTNQSGAQVHSVKKRGLIAKATEHEISSAPGTIYTVADVAAMLGLKLQTNGKWRGAPDGTSATKDGFTLCPEGNAFTNSGDKYKSKEVAELAGIEPGQYEPIAQFKARNGSPVPSRQTLTKPAQIAVKSPAKATSAISTKAKAPFYWDRAQTFDYTDENGELLYQVGRCDAPNCEKSIRQRRPDGRGGWANQLGDITRVLYRLPDVMAAQTVFICEGEKAANALNATFERACLFGEYVATTNAQGAGKWGDEMAESLDGKTVCVLPDNDTPGDAHGATVCASIEASERAATLKRLDLPNLPEKGDVADWIEAGGTVSELLELFKAAPNWKPPAPARRFNFAPLAEVMTRPDPEFLIYRVLPMGAPSLLTATHASFKSFIALDMALSVATGRAWHGFNVRRGAVVYVAAEGASGIKKRARAWLEFYGEKTPDNFVILDVPFQVADAKARADFISEVSELKPVLIILDTLARCAVGLEENSSKDMGEFADALGELAKATGANVLTVHHNNKGGAYRGSSAVPAAVDTHLSLERKSDGDGLHVAILKIEKQKDFEEIEPLTFEGKTVTIPDTRGLEHSLVFERVETNNGSAYSLSDSEQKVLSELVAAFSDEGATASGWGQVCLEAGIPTRTFRRAKERLIKLGAVSCPNKGEKGAKFTPVSDWGQGAKMGPCPSGPNAYEGLGPRGHTPLGVAPMSPISREATEVDNSDQSRPLESDDREGGEI